MSRAAVFLDRDGVLNDVDEQGRSPRTAGELHIATDGPWAVQQLRQASFVTIVVTNQPDVARNTMTAETADAMNALVRLQTGVDALYMCPHAVEDQCLCRKPLPGLLTEAASDLGLDLGASWLIGDRWVDIQAAQAVGVRAVLLENPHSWLPTSVGPPPAGLVPLHRARSLPACVQLILADVGLSTSARPDPR